MIKATIRLDEAEVVCGVISIYQVDGTAYAALIPLKEGEEDPAKSDVMIFGCEISEDEECSFYELDDEKEYHRATEAFFLITDQFKEGEV